MTTLDFYPAQAHRFATTLDDHARTRANIDRAVDDLRGQYIPMAVEFLTLGYTEVAADVMAELLAAQCAVAKIRHLAVVS